MTFWAILTDQGLPATLAQARVAVRHVESLIALQMHMSRGRAINEALQLIQGQDAITGDVRAMEPLIWADPIQGTASEYWIYRATSGYLIPDKPTFTASQAQIAAALGIPGEFPAGDVTMSANDWLDWSLSESGLMRADRVGDPIAWQDQ